MNKPNLSQMSDIRRHINDPFSVHSFDSEIGSDPRRLYDGIAPSKPIDIKVKSFNPFGHEGKGQLVSNRRLQKKLNKKRKATV